MKKIIMLLLTLLVIVTNPVVTFANDTTELYAYSANTEAFDAYAKEELGLHLYTYYGYQDNSLKLGKGIKVLGKETPTVLYPVWKNDKIVGTFNVVYYDGQYGGSYSSGNAEQLNHAKEVATQENPIKLVKTNEHFMYIIDGVAYDLSTGIGKVLSNVNVPSYSSEKLIKVNAASSLEYDRLNTRAAANYTLSWNPTEHYGDSNIYCYAYALSPILKGLGYSSYTVNSIKSGLNNAPGVTFDALRNYLTNEGFLYQSSSSGSMDSTNVVNWIYNNRKHILVGLEVTTASSTPKHFGTIIGYTSSNGSYSYKIYDPQHNESNGVTTMPASNKTFTNSDGSTFVWNSGYITNIR